MPSLAIHTTSRTIADIGFCLSHRAVFFTVPLVGAVFAQIEEQTPDAPWFEHRNEEGEHLVWLGRLKLILTPWRLLD